MFEPYRGNQRFCSAACRFNAWETNNPRIRVETPELAELQRGQARRVRAALEGFRAGRPLTRGELCTATGLADRTIRAAIAYLVIREHVPVVHVRGGGYYIARDTESIDREMAQIGSRIRRLTERMDGYRKAKLELMGRAG